MKLICFVIPSILSLTLVCASLAEDVSIYASVDRKTVPVGGVITLTIHIQGSQAVAAPKLPDIEGFESRYVGPSTRLSVINGRSSVAVAHRYYLKAMKTGRFTIPSIAVRYDGRTYRTKPIDGILVVPASESLRRKPMTTEELRKYIRLDILAKKKTAYVNEEVPVIIRLYIRGGVNVQDFKYPKFPSTGFLVLPFSNPVKRQTTISGVLFQAVDFPTTVYPVATGELTLGPAELDCRLTTEGVRSRPGDPFFDGLFGRQVRYLLTVRSEPCTITVKPLPATGQPEGFEGAVGQYSLDVIAKPTSLKVGEPVTLTMTIRGRGNIDTVSAPRIAGLTQFKVYKPQISVRKKGGSGEKTFEQVLIPTSADINAIPKVTFSYFDPEAEQYKTLTRGPIQIQVAPSDTTKPLQIFEIAGGRAVKREILGRDIVYIKDEVGSVRRGDGHLYKSKGFLLFQLLPLIGFVGALAYQKRRERFATDRRYARRHHAFKRARKGLAQARRLMMSSHPQAFCSAVFRTMQEYLGDRFDLPPAGITIGIVDDLRSHGVPEEVLARLTDLFHSCDRIRFARSEVSGHEMDRILDLATESIRLLEDIEVAV